MEQIATIAFSCQVGISFFFFPFSFSKQVMSGSVNVYVHSYSKEISIYDLTNTYWSGSVNVYVHSLHFPNGWFNKLYLMTLILCQLSPATRGHDELKDEKFLKLLKYMSELKVIP